MSSIKLLLFSSKLKQKLWFFSVFVFLNLSPNIAFSEIYPTGNKNYTCKLNQECLDELNNKFLNKKSQDSLYHICKDYHRKVESCCASPNQCNLPYAKNITKDLDSSRSNLVKQSQGSPLSCQLNRLSNFINSLSESQNSACNTGIENCNITCQNELEFFKSKFRQCFFIQDSHTIDSVLKKAKANSTRSTCLKEINKIANKYTKQSLNKKSLFNEDIKAIDIINCNSIERFANKQNLNNLALNVCYQAKAQQEQELQQQKQVKDIKLNPKEEKYTSIDEWEERQKRHLQDAAANSGRRYEEEASNLNQKNKKANQFNQDRFSKEMANPKWGIVDDPDSKKNTTNKTNSNLGAMTGASLVAGASIGSSKVKNSSQKSKTKQANNKLTSPQETSSSFTGSSHSQACPTMPEIKSAVVFQSVEAPQIEPMDKQNHPPYDEFDMVHKKLGGVFVEIDIANMKKNKEFYLALYIEGEKDYRYKCFHTPKGMMIEGQESTCSFTKSNLVNNDSKFFPLTLDKSFEGNTKELRAVVVIYEGSDTRCQKRKSFKMKIFKTSDFKLGFTRIDGGKNCKRSYNRKTRASNRRTGYNTIPFLTVQNFSVSDEVKQIESMFPVTSISSDPITYIFKNQSYKQYNYIEGNCDNTKKKSFNHENITSFLLSDIDELNHLRKSLSYDKIVAIVPKEYFLFHNMFSVDNGDIHAVNGMIITPSWEQKRSWQNLWGLLNFLELETEGRHLGGSWNVAFVGDSELNRGTVAHELGHTLGQRRDLYEELERCRHFKGHSLKECSNEKFIPKSLNTGLRNGKRFWELITKEKFTIMNNKSDIYEQWIDRDTYQKSLWTLSTFLSPIIPPWINLLKEANEARLSTQKTSHSLKAVVSGFYYEKENTFINPKKRIQKTNQVTAFLPSKNIKLSLATFLLKKGGKVFDKVKRPIFKMEMELLHGKDNLSETIPFPYSPTRAIMNLPEKVFEEKLQIEVLDPKGKLIYKSTISKEELRKWF